VDRVLFEGRRAVGVVADVNGQPETFRADGEVIVCGGALMSPQILQRSGIGAASLLRDLGIEVVADLPAVGEHLLERRPIVGQWNLSGPYSDNPKLRGWRVAANVLRYYLTRGGPMAVAYAGVIAFARVLPESDRPDIQLQLAPMNAIQNAKGEFAIDDKHSILVSAYPLRPRSEGRIRISSADPAQPARIRAAYLDDPYDCAVTVAMDRFTRRWMHQPAIAPLIAEEKSITADSKTDDEVIAAYRRFGQASVHTCGTCRMGNADDAVVDEHLRVHGVENLRVVDASILPSFVSANTNGPVMAVAWRAAELIGGRT
jgi:choline dehydrogenase-like flavoprotein